VVLPRIKSRAVVECVCADAEDVYYADEGCGDEETILPVQEVRYLRVVNDTDAELTVWATFGEDTHTWTFEPGETAYLEVDGERLSAAQVFIWGKADSGARWGKYKNNALVLVPRPYRAETIGTFTFTFR
jgi:hypothetical protein